MRTPLHRPPLPAPARTAARGPVRRVGAPVGRFLIELAAMCAVMCLGGTVLAFTAFATAGLLGRPDLAAQAPVVSVLINTVCLSVPMATYMAVRGHPRRHNVVVTGSTVVVGVVLAGLVGFGVASTVAVQTWHALFGLACLPACALMVVEMLFGFNMYSGQVQHHSQTT